jgi:hypothetical protein
LTDTDAVRAALLLVAAQGTFLSLSLNSSAGALAMHWPFTVSSMQHADKLQIDTMHHAFNEFW